MKRLFFPLIVLFLSCSAGYGAVKGEEVTYEADGVQLKGYIAYDDAVSAKRPGILVVHEWWGHNEYARRRARMLAELGYTALAVDMYGEGKQAAHPEDAGKFAGQIKKNMAMGRKRFLAGQQVLKNHQTVDDTKIGAIGYCFGGGIVLQMARDGVDLAGVVSFHGGLSTDSPAAKGKVKAKIMVCNGGADGFVKAEDITSFILEMKKAEVQYYYISYPGAIHSFTNPEADEYAEKFGLAVGYNAAADARSWNDMQYFFQSIF